MSVKIPFQLESSGPMRALFASACITGLYLHVHNQTHTDTHTDAANTHPGTRWAGDTYTRTQQGAKMSAEETHGHTHHAFQPQREKKKGRPVAFRPSLMAAYCANAVGWSDGALQLSSFT